MIRPRLATSLLLAWAAPASLPAQQVAAHSNVAINIRVRPALAIRGVVPMTARMDAAGHIAATSVVHVESNLPYRLTVRLAPAPRSDAARVLVRGASGAFELLTPRSSIVIVAGSAAGHRPHEIHCRVEGPTHEAPAANACPLTYELAAQYEDSVVKATAAPAYDPRPRDARLREGSRPVAQIPRGS